MFSTDKYEPYHQHPHQIPQVFQIPPFLIHLLDFLHHFTFFFLLPFVAIVFSAFVAAALVLRLHRALFGRYATPQELLEDALGLLKKDGWAMSAIVADGNSNGAGRRRKPFQLSSFPRTTMAQPNSSRWKRFFPSNERPCSPNRKRALDTLRLVIQLQPDMIKAYVVLATELFYGELHHSEKNNHQKEPKHQQLTSKMGIKLQRIMGGERIVPLFENSFSFSTPSSLKSTTGDDRSQTKTAMQQYTQQNLSPSLAECQEVIEQGLTIDPTNDALLKLQSELLVVMKFGKSGVHAKMMSVGSFGWIGG